MKINFKVGDKVVCINNIGYSKKLKLGAVYTVLEFEASSNIRINTFEQYSTAYMITRFRLATLLEKELANVD